MNMTSSYKPSRFDGEAHKVYWCTTKDHADDLLIVANSTKQARYELANELGCEEHEVQASLVINLKKRHGLEYVCVGHLEDDILRGCGAFIGYLGPARIVYWHAYCFVEGILDFIMEESRRQLGPEGLKELLERNR